LTGNMVETHFQRHDLFHLRDMQASVEVCAEGRASLGGNDSKLELDLTTIGRQDGLTELLGPCSSSPVEGGCR
jgi:hypothetical protein